MLCVVTQILPQDVSCGGVISGIRDHPCPSVSTLTMLGVVSTTTSGIQAMASPKWA